MGEVQRILDQMDRAFSGDAWHGPPLMRLLDGFSAEDASKHAVPHAHSIWELVHHIGSWNSIVQHRLQGETVDVTAQLDWPPVWEVSEPSWKRALENLAESRSRLRGVAAALRDDQLDEKVGTTDVSRYQILHGVIQHDLYHAGQIAVLKKALGLTAG
ncbi:MAG TPA: DinB family protein [Candidatus Baltobacteraceae bacterium]|nr:DinB family protein [Candidatus Baltobacteraceae bacterium]